MKNSAKASVENGFFGKSEEIFEIGMAGF